MVKLKLNRQEFKSYFEFERPDNTLISYFGLGIEYFIFPLVLIVALFGSVTINLMKGGYNRK